MPDIVLRSRKAGVQSIILEHLLLESLGQCEREFVVFFCLTIALHALSPLLSENGIFPFISCNNCSA